MIDRSTNEPGGQTPSANNPFRKRRDTMIKRKFIHLLFSLLIVASLVGGNINVSAAPTSPTDESQVPHYFGPYPNWANSPYALPDA
jgi:hypothetical protein